MESILVQAVKAEMGLLLEIAALSAVADAGIPDLMVYSAISVCIAPIPFAPLPFVLALPAIPPTSLAAFIVVTAAESIPFCVLDKDAALARLRSAVTVRLCEDGGAAAAEEALAAVAAGSE